MIMSSSAGWGEAKHAFSPAPILWTQPMLTPFLPLSFSVDDGSSIQDYLLQLTGARTVPRVFIAEKCVGGGSDVQSLHDQKKLVPMLKEAGVL